MFELQGNQSTLCNNVQVLFSDKPVKMKFVSSESVEKGHGRIETRVCTITEDIDWQRRERVA